MPSATRVRSIVRRPPRARTCIAGECAYLDRPSARGFERPYGWAWLLKLAAELALHETPQGHAWANALRARWPPASPTASAHSCRSAPIRYAPASTATPPSPSASPWTTRTLPCAPCCGATAQRWYAADTDCQAWEPGGDEFLSPTLIEAECMRAALPEAEFRVWFARFLPRLDQRQPATLFTPASVSDRSDGKIAHLDGLNLSRSWCWRALAASAPDPEAIMDDRPGAYRRQPAACQRRLHGRALAGKLRAAGAVLTESGPLTQPT